MPTNWTCHVCGKAVSWGAVVCPLCGSALYWEEDMEDQHATNLSPLWDGSTITMRKRWIRRYASIGIGVGILLVILSIVSGRIVWSLLILGLIMATAGIYGLVTLPDRYL
jgi:hypothetical protein